MTDVYRVHDKDRQIRPYTAVYRVHDKDGFVVGHVFRTKGGWHYAARGMESVKPEVHLLTAEKACPHGKYLGKASYLSKGPF